MNQADALGHEGYLKSGAGRRFLKARGEAFTRYTHVLNKPGIGVKSPLD